MNGKWQDLDFSKLPKETQLAAANARLQFFEKNYGEYADWELSGSDKFKDIKLKDISRVDDFNAGDVKSKLEGGIVVEMVSKLLQTKGAEAPKMGELTLAEYNKFTKNPDEFAQSRFVGEQDFMVSGGSFEKRNVGFVDPEEY